jgi:predicted peptidase
MDRIFNTLKCPVKNDIYLFIEALHSGQDQVTPVKSLIMSMKIFEYIKISLKINYKINL